jgi:hypothetical protein
MNISREFKGGASRMRAERGTGAKYKLKAENKDKATETREQIEE